MKHSLFFFITFLSILWIFSSCHSLVDDEFPEFAKAPVLNAMLEADSTIRVQLSLTANLTDTAPTYVSNARVIIECGVAAPDTLIYTDEGWYVSARTAKAGASYSCKAEIPGYSTISAQTTIPTRTEIGEVLYTDLAGRGEEAEKISPFEFAIANVPTQSKYWEVQLLSAGMRTSYNPKTQDWLEKYEEYDENIYMLVAQDSILLGEANPLTLFSNKRIKGSSYKVKFYLNSTYTNLDDTDEYKPVVVLKSVDESYYRYMKQLYIYETSGYVTIGQAQQFYPLYSNVKNGLGVFTGVSVTRKELAPLTPKGE